MKSFSVVGSCNTARDAPVDELVDGDIWHWKTFLKTKKPFLNDGIFM